MPYRLRKAPKKNSYWVIGEDGTHHSNEPLPLARAKKQLIALNIAHAEKVKKGGAWYDIFNPKKVVNEFVNPDSVLRRGVKKVTNEFVNPDSVARRRIKDVSRGIRADYPPSSRRTIEKYGDWRIENLALRRDPIQSALHTAFQFVTLGQWNKARAAENKDKLFHLGIVLGLVGPSGEKTAVVVEKNEVINVGPAKPTVEGTEMGHSPAPMGQSLRGFLDKGLAAVGPERFFKYDPFKNNCQDFVAMLLRANGVYTPPAEAFVKQDIDGLLSKLPGWTGAVAKGITDLGGLVNVAVEGGKRKMRGGHFPASYKNTVRHMYNQITLLDWDNRYKPVIALLEYIIQKNLGTTMYELTIQNLANALYTRLTEEGATIAEIWELLGRVVGGIQSEPGAQLPSGNPPYPPSKATGMGRGDSKKNYTWELLMKLFMPIYNKHVLGKGTLRGGILNAAQIRDLDADQRAFDNAHALTTRRSLADSFFNKVDGYRRRGHLERMSILEFRAVNPPHSHRWIYVPDNTNMNVGYVYYMVPPPTAAELAERARLVRRPTVAVRPGPRPGPVPTVAVRPEPTPAPVPQQEDEEEEEDPNAVIRERNRVAVAMNNLRDQVGIGNAWAIPEAIPDFEYDIGEALPVRPSLRPRLNTNSIQMMGAEPIPTYWGHIRTADPIRARAPPPPPPPPEPEWLPFSQAHLTEQEKADRKLLSKSGKGKRKPDGKKVIETPARKRNKKGYISEASSVSESSSESDSDSSYGDEVGFDYISDDESSSSESEGEQQPVAGRGARRGRR